MAGTGGTAQWREGGPARGDQRGLQECSDPPAQDPLTSKTTTRHFPDHYNVAKHRLILSRLKILKISGRITAFSGNIVSLKLGQRQKGYNRAFYGPRFLLTRTGKTGVSPSSRIIPGMAGDAGHHDAVRELRPVPRACFFFAGERLEPDILVAGIFGEAPQVRVKGFCGLHAGEWGRAGDEEAVWAWRK